MRPAQVPTLLAVLSLVAACDSEPSELPEDELPALTVGRVEPSTVLPGTRVKVHGSGFAAATLDKLSVELRGPGGERVIDAEREGDKEFRFPVDAALFAALGGPGEFAGAMLVRADYIDGRYQTVGVSLDWTLVETLTPALTRLTPLDGIVYLGTEIEGEGSGFLLDGEGATALHFSGTFQAEDAATPEPWSGACVVAAEQRELLRGPLSADCFGVAPGVFEGEVAPINRHGDGGAKVNGAGLNGLSVELGPTVLLRVEPTAASRGQQILLGGRGFVGGSATTTVRLEGSFTDGGGQVTDLTGADALEIVPEVLAGDSLRYVLRPVPDGQGGVSGFGASAGVLRATATPLVYHTTGVQQGLPLAGDLDFTVLPQRQVVYVKYLPGFTDTLRDFGLRDVEHDIRERILEVNQRDYQGVNVSFVTTRPTDFVEYSVIEVGGVDPNGRGLMGLDATMGKDTGNLDFDDVIGGFNAESRESGHYAYGGVFISSYLGFSQSAADPLPIASPRFDDIFSGFMPDRGGQPAESWELQSGARSEAIVLAIHALGSMIGNTISHEIGHTLGLAAGPDELFHNPVSAPNQIMDSGIDRPFEERAEIDGQGPAVFTYENRAYLEHILPE